jgi:hypothetical protein
MKDKKIKSWYPDMAPLTNKRRPFVFNVSVLSALFNWLSTKCSYVELQVNVWLCSLLGHIHGEKIWTPYTGAYFQCERCFKQRYIKGKWKILVWPCFNYKNVVKK